MTLDPATRRIELLLVEDSPTDVLITREAIKSAGLAHVLHVVEDGVEAMAFLRREGKYARAPRPDLVLLDLNLPRKTGGEVLAELKVDEQLKAIPVVVLSSSRDQADVSRAYRLYANCYLAKPVDFPSLVELISSLKRFWVGTATLPDGA